MEGWLSGGLEYRPWVCGVGYGYASAIGDVIGPTTTPPNVSCPLRRMATSNNPGMGYVVKKGFGAMLTAQLQKYLICLPTSNKRGPFSPCLDLSLQLITRNQRPLKCATLILCKRTFSADINIFCVSKVSSGCWQSLRRPLFGFLLSLLLEFVCRTKQ